MKVVHCPCGTDVEGETDDALVENVQAHIAADHPDLVGKYSREQIVEMAARALSERSSVSALAPGVACRPPPWQP